MTGTSTSRRPRGERPLHAGHHDDHRGFTQLPGVGQQAVQAGDADIGDFSHAVLEHPGSDRRLAGHRQIGGAGTDDQNRPAAKIVKGLLHQGEGARQRIVLAAGMVISQDVRLFTGQTGDQNVAPLAAMRVTMALTCSTSSLRREWFPALPGAGRGGGRSAPSPYPRREITQSLQPLVDAEIAGLDGAEQSFQLLLVHGVSEEIVQYVNIEPWIFKPFRTQAVDPPRYHRRSNLSVATAGRSARSLLLLNY